MAYDFRLGLVITVDYLLLQPVANLDGVKSEEVDPRLVFHYGIPSGAILLAYDSIQQILAISTK